MWFWDKCHHIKTCMAAQAAYIVYFTGWTSWQYHGDHGWSTSVCGVGMEKILLSKSGIIKSAVHHFFLYYPRLVTLHWQLRSLWWPSCWFPFGCHFWPLLLHKITNDLHWLDQGDTNIHFCSFIFNFMRYPTHHILRSTT